MKKNLLVSLLFILVLFSSFQNSQDFRSLNENLLTQNIIEKFPEKIYIHTDKHYYMAGEDIWFTSYLVNGITHQYSTKSRVLYVELINEKDSIISHRKLFIDEVSAAGDIKLPIDLKDGIYQLRAYTNYMRNQSQDFFFNKKIPIYALYSELDESEKPGQSKTNLEMPDIGFYPEGGYLIYGLRNKVAVKIDNADLESRELTGTIEDKEGNKVAQFTTKEFGLASFYLVPETGKEYQAVITSKNKEHLYLLPKPLAQGYVLNTTISDDHIDITIKTNLPIGLKNAKLQGHQRGNTVFDFNFKDKIQKINLQILKTELRQGVVNLVLFDETDKPIVERLLYIDKEDEVSVSINKTTGFTQTREKVNFEIDVKDNLGRLVPSSLSISVTNADLMAPNPYAENIKTWLLLNSDLRGKIKDPNYFFTKENIQHKQELLDLVMMTNGWRRFIWQEFSQSSPRLKFEPEDGIYINGHTISSKTPYQHKVSETKLTFRNNGFYQEIKKTDSLAYFSYGPFEFKDSIDVLLAVNIEKPSESETNIILKSPLDAPIIASDPSISKFKWPIADVKTYREKSRSNVMKNFKFDEDREMLDEVLVKGKVKTKHEIRNINRVEKARATNPSHRIFVDGDPRGTGDFITLIENIPGVRMELIDDAEVMGHLIITLHGRVPDFYLDNMKVNIDDARSVSQSGIDFIDVIRAGGAASTQFALSGQGIIAIYTKRGGRGVENIDYGQKIGSINFKSHGFYTHREFYSPDHSSDKNLSQREDRRSTLYWNPKLITRYYDNAKASFYSSDDKGKFHIEIQGITDEGVPIYSTELLEVQ